MKLKNVLVLLPLAFMLSACQGGGKFDGKWILDTEKTMEQAKITNGGELTQSDLRKVNEIAGVFSSVMIEDNKFSITSKDLFANCEISEKDIATCTSSKRPEPLSMNVFFDGEGSEKRLVLTVESARLYMKSE